MARDAARPRNTGKFVVAGRGASTCRASPSHPRVGGWRFFLPTMSLPANNNTDWFSNPFLACRTLEEGAEVTLVQLFARLRDQPAGRTADFDRLDALDPIFEQLRVTFPRWR